MTMFKKVVWATDGSAAADRALPQVKALAKDDQSAVLVVHSVEILVGPRASGLPLHADEDERKAKIAQQVEQLKQEGIEASLTLVGGPGVNPAHMIADVAREEQADLIIVGTRGHTPAVELLVGSVTLRLLHLADCPVLAVPPGRA
jgi:nucleotide-binding universal stress UspA family protein